MQKVNEELHMLIIADAHNWHWIELGLLQMHDIGILEFIGKWYVS